MHKLDKTDLRILTTLLENARTSYAALARETNLTIPSIKTRIQKYIDTGLIEKFTIILDEHMIDLDKVSKDIFESPYIANLTITSGHYNLLIVTHPMSDKDKLEFIKAVNTLPGESIIELVSSINLETFMCKPIELPKTPINLLIRCD